MHEAQLDGIRLAEVSHRDSKELLVGNVQSIDSNTKRTMMTVVKYYSNSNVP